MNNIVNIFVLIACLISIQSTHALSKKVTKENIELHDGVQAIKITFDVSTVEGCDQFRIYLYDSWIDGEKLDLSISDICYKGEEEKYFSLIYLRDPILRKKKRFLGKKLDTDNYLEYYTEITKYIKNNKGRFLGSKVIGAFLLIVMAPATPPVNKINQYYDSLGEIGLKLYFMEKVEYDADWGPQQSTNHFNPIYESQRYIGIFVGIKF